jgi:hypothetical protein
MLSLPRRTLSFFAREIPVSQRSLSAITLVLVLVALLGVIFPQQSQSLVLKVFPSGDCPDMDADGNPAPSSDELAKYLNLLSRNKRLRNAGFEALERDWQPTDYAMLLQVLEFISHRTRQEQAYELLRKKSGQNLPAKLDDWYDWLWQMRPAVDPRLRTLKCRLYSKYTQEFVDYFDDDVPALIAYDEIRFTCPLPGYIGALRVPRWIDAADATNLADSDEVFAIQLNDEVRAYPRKVISRYHFSTDSIGGEPYLCVYDPQAETLLCFKTSSAAGHRLKASFFQHRSAILLCDEKTKSLWSVENGQPVVGPLVGKGLQLERIPVATGTWADWRKQHNAAKVLADSRSEEMKADDD